MRNSSIRSSQSPAYGERWAQVWLDLARYADSNGYAEDQPRTIWKFRDWVIQAINKNQPFDRFTVEQIAGDMLPNPTPEQIIATAFHRNTLTNTEGGTNDEEFRNIAVVDRVNTTLQVWMGLSMACAQCHDHKYDPISQEEYFRVFAIFNQSEDSDKGDNSPNYRLPVRGRGQEEGGPGGRDRRAGKADRQAAAQPGRRAEEMGEGSQPRQAAGEHQGHSRASSRPSANRRSSKTLASYLPLDLAGRRTAGCQDSAAQDPDRPTCSRCRRRSCANCRPASNG